MSMAMPEARDQKLAHESRSRSPLVGEHVRATRERWGVSGRVTI